jgi:hypothetical protein
MPLHIDLTTGSAQERDDYRAATETFARAIHMLTVENDNFRKKLDKRRSSAVTALPSRR